MSGLRGNGAERCFGRLTGCMGDRSSTHWFAVPGCSLVWLSHPPKPEDMHLHYTDAYHKLISAGGQNSPQRWRDRKEALAPYKQSGALLDLGCSSGSFLESMHGESWKLYGIEMSADCARTAEERSGAKCLSETSWMRLSTGGRLRRDHLFRCVRTSLRAARVMAKIREWLKPGGIFYVLVPNIDSAEARVFGSYWHGLEMPRHLFHYSPASLNFWPNRRVCGRYRSKHGGTPP